MIFIFPSEVLLVIIQIPESRSRCVSSKLCSAAALVVVVVVAVAAAALLQQ